MITFTKNLSTNKILYAYNNNIVEFNADFNGVAPAYCDIIINGVLAATIYPIGNKFWYNFKEVASTLVNRNSFQDLTDINLNSDNSNSFIVNETQNKYIHTSVAYSVRYIDGSSEVDTINLYFLRGVRQNKLDYKASPISVLTPNVTQESISNLKFIQAYAKYWDGFPFDLTLLVRLGIPSDSLKTSIQIVNNTNSLSHSFSTEGNVSRLIFSDGRTNQTIELFLPLVDGLNNLKIQNNFIINIEKVIDGCGVYIKWLNPQGGWSYWLFTEFYQENKSTRSLGQINNDYKDIDDTTSPNYSLGKSEQNRLSVTSDLINQNENSLLKTLFASPKVYLFTGKQFSQNTFNDWLAVELNNNSVTTKNYKNDFVQYEVEIVMPELNTLKL